MGQINNQRIAIVIFPSLPMGMESAVQFVGEAFRPLPVLGESQLPIYFKCTTLRQRRDYYRDRLHAPDHEWACPQRVALFNALMGM